jgi:hypothetical protein
LRCEDLQRARVATILAIQGVLGAVKNGNCFLVAMTGGAPARANCVPNFDRAPPQ